MEPNFECKDCGCFFKVVQYSMKVATKTEYYTKDQKRVSCPECSSIEVEYIVEEGEINVNFGKFSSSSDEGKKRMLHQRAEKMKKKTEEQHRLIDREFRGRVNPNHY